MNDLFESTELKTGVGDASPGSLIKNGKGPRPVILTDTANLDVRQTEFYREPHACIPKYIVLQCNCGRHIVPSVCMSLVCPNCKEAVNKRRSESIFRRLVNQSMKKSRRNQIKPVIYTVLTVPESERSKYLDPKAWQKVRKKAWKLLKSKFGALYGVEVSHPVGDKDANKFHPHLNFLWIQRDGFRPFLDVEKLRESWGEILNVAVADVYTRYSNHVRQIKHWCNYTSRVFVGLHKWTGSVRWYGKYPRKKTEVTCPCTQCSGKYKMIGWIDKLDVDNYYKHGFIIGVDPPWLNDNNIRWK